MWPQCPTLCSNFTCTCFCFVALFSNCIWVILVQTCVVYHLITWHSSQCATHIVCICRVLFPDLSWNENSSAGNSTLQSGPVYGSQSAIHGRPRLMMAVLTDCYSERDAAVRHAPHTHKPQSIWVEANKEMCPHYMLLEKFKIKRNLHSA